MSYAVAIRGSGLALGKGYDPITNESASIQRAWSQKRNYLQGSASDWLPSLDAALDGIRNDCRAANWDGEGACPVTEQVIDLAGKIAEKLFAMLPKGTPIPDVVPEPDGEIGIGWIVDAGHVFSLSVGAHDKMNFAGQFGKEGSIHGWHPIDATSSGQLEKSLEEMVRQISRLYPVLTGGRGV